MFLLIRSDRPFFFRGPPRAPSAREAARMTPRGGSDPPHLPGSKPIFDFGVGILWVPKSYFRVSKSSFGSAGDVFVNPFGLKRTEIGPY